MTVIRSTLSSIGVIVMLGMLLIVGCQAQTDEPPAAEPTAVDQATATAVLVDDEPETKSTPMATITPTAPAVKDVQTEPAEAATEEQQMSDEETPTPAIEESEAGAGANADVEYVRAVQSADGAWTFHVTVRHPDTGWEDYADGWDVVTPDGQVLKASAADPFTRLLLHPHENEQPFTRSQSGVVVPDGVTTVTVRAHDLVDGFGGREISVDLTVEGGPGFEVERR